MATNTRTPEELKAYLAQPEIEGLLNLTTLERLAGIPKYSLADYVKGRTVYLKVEHLPKIEKVLEKLKF